MSTNRIDAFRKVCEKFYIDLRPEGDDEWKAPSASSEDAMDYVDGTQEITEPWVAVTMHDDIYYAEPGYATKGLAENRCAEYVTDSIHSELPVAVVNIDTGNIYYPEYVTVTMLEKPSTNLSKVTA